jgi:hypothetical protein
MTINLPVTNLLQSLGDFGYYAKKQLRAIVLLYVGRNKAMRSYGTHLSLSGLNRQVDSFPAC